MVTMKTSDMRTGAGIATGGSLPPTDHHRVATAAPEPDPRRKARAEEIQRAYREGIAGIVRAGEMLRDLKQEMLAGAGAEKVEGYREFRAFYEKDLGWPKSQVNRLIDVAEAFGGHLDLVDRFDLSALYALSRATAEQRDQALERARHGEFVSNKDAAELIRPATAGPGKGTGKKARSPRDYAIPIPDGSVVVAAPHRTLADVRAALQAALEVIDARIARRTRKAVPAL